MKQRSSGILKLIASLSSMAKSKTLALKSKTNAIKARLIIFSLVMNKKYLMSSISEKFHSVFGHHLKEDCLLGNNDSDQNKSSMVEFNENTILFEAVTNPCETQTMVEEDKEQIVGYESCYRYDYDDDDNDGGDGKYPDLTHTMFDSEDLDIGGSVIDLVKSSKEEAGQEFKMEDEIDYMADLFIKRFRKQILLQKQDSLNRSHEMVLKDGV